MPPSFKERLFLCPYLNNQPYIGCTCVESWKHPRRLRLENLRQRFVQPFLSKNSKSWEQNQSLRDTSMRSISAQCSIHPCSRCHWQHPPSNRRQTTSVSQTSKEQRIGKRQHNLSVFRKKQPQPLHSAGAFFMGFHLEWSDLSINRFVVYFPFFIPRLPPNGKNINKSNIWNRKTRKRCQHANKPTKHDCFSKFNYL